MENKDIAKMTGQSNGERVAAYKLNEVRFNGDSGDFTLRKLLEEKDAEGHYPTQELGKKISGVILKMRWRLAKYEVDKPGILTSEYDNKNLDTIIVFGTNEKGLAVDLKEKYGLSSQRVLYLLTPGNQVVRLIVKASALSGENNPGGELGLFDYLDDLNKTGTFVHEYLTDFSGVYREDPKNPRKNYWAMTFKCGKGLEEPQKEKVLELIKEVHEKTTGTPFAETAEEVAPTDSDEVRPEDIPF